jgi:serine/threonine-protein kinase
MMGVVYRALDPALGRSVALKTVGLSFAVPDDERQAFERRFLAEARVAAALAHPGIVVVHDVGRDAVSGVLYIALELLPGRTLADLVAGGTPLAPEDALRITARVAEALHHAHARGIVHRDIKPANIMVLPSGEPKIMDFGIAKVPTAQLTAAGQFFGTPSYMSPEQASGMEIDGRSDLFSLGAVLYVLLTGRRAFDAPTIPSILTQVVMEDPPPPSRFVAGLPPGVDELVARSLAKQPGMRYEDCAAFARDLDAVRAGTPPADRPGPAVRKDDAPDRPVSAVRKGDASDRPVSAVREVDEPAGLESLLEPLEEPPTVVSGSPQGSQEAAVDRGDSASAVLVTASQPAAVRGLRNRRAVLAAAALLLVGLGVALFAPRGERPALVPLLEPSRLEIDFEHPLKSGTLKVWLDDELVVEEPLESRVTRKVLALRFRKGRTEKDLEVAPGEHVVRVEVAGDGFDDARRIRGSFESGVTRRLHARVGGLFNRELSLVWGASIKPSGSPVP